MARAIRKHRLTRRWKVAILTVAILGIMAATPWVYLGITIGPDGIWNPGTTYERYRGAEYPTTEPFFQWWYFSLKDYATGMTFAFVYSMSRPATNLTNTGAYMLVALVNRTSRFQLYYKYPLSQFTTSGDFNVTIAQAGQIDVIDASHYHLLGNLNDSSQVWASEDISATSTVSWNLSVVRIAGWYGEQDIEGIARQAGLIAWNTYAYDAEVNGTVAINGTTYPIMRGPQFRIYCDMNWGSSFPHGTPDIDYPWGWYYTGQPANSTADDFSIIAGVGRTQTGSVLGSLDGRFASMYLQGRQLGVRMGIILGQPTGGGGVEVFQRATDGVCYEFQVNRSDWVTYTDRFGSASIPLVQVMTIETNTIRVVMTFDSTTANYNRLLFPTDGYVFSDFEGLGVNCTTQIYQRSFASYDWLHTVPVYTLVDTINDTMAGVEFGYQVPVAM
jgi:hypothetical protein